MKSAPAEVAPIFPVKLSTLPVAVVPTKVSTAPPFCTMMVPALTATPLAAASVEALTVMAPLNPEVSTEVTVLFSLVAP